MKRFFVIAVAVFMLGGCYWNADKIKAMAPARFEQAGFSIIAMEGTQMSPTGGSVWYVLKKNGSQNGVYQACLSFMMSGDLGLYNLESVDSVNAKIEN